MASFEFFATIGYSLTVFGALFVAFCYNIRSKLIALQGAVRRPLLKHVFYSTVVHSPRFKLRWSRAEFLAKLSYLGFSVFCLCFKSQDLSTAGHRAGTMCIGNLILLYITPHLDALTNTLGLQWHTVRKIHGSVGFMAFLLLVFHIIAFAFSKAPFSMSMIEHKWAVIVSIHLRPVLSLDN